MGVSHLFKIKQPTLTNSEQKTQKTAETQTEFKETNAGRPGKNTFCLLETYTMP